MVSTIYSTYNYLSPPMESVSSETVDKMRSISGKMWRCFSYRPDLKKGNIYEFIFRPQFNDRSLYKDKNSEIFPAVEKGPDAFLEWDEQYDRKKMMDNAIKDDSDRNSNDSFWVDCLNQEFMIVDRLKQLGYNFRRESDGDHLYLPDREALLARWKRVKEETPELNLPDLDIMASEGIASDQEYIEGYLKHDTLLSADTEFVHDHQYHVVNVLSNILRQKEGFSYKKDKQFRVEGIKTECKRIELAKRAIREQLASDELKKYISVFDTMLAALTDTIAGSEGSYYALQEIKIFEREFMSGSDCLNDSWINYLKRRVSDVVDRDLIKRLDREISRLDCLPNLNRKRKLNEIFFKTGQNLG